VLNRTNRASTVHDIKLGTTAHARPIRMMLRDKGGLHIRPVRAFSGVRQEKSFLPGSCGAHLAVVSFLERCFARRLSEYGYGRGVQGSARNSFELLWIVGTKELD